MMERMKISKKTLALITLISGANLILPIAFAQTPSDLGLSITPGTLSIYCEPIDITMPSVDIVSPVTTYYSYYVNPYILQIDGCTPALNTGTNLTVQDGRYAGGFELQAQVSDDYTSGSDIIAHANLGVKTDTSSLSETVTPGLTATTFPLDAGSTSNPADYTDFSGMAIVLIEACTGNATSEGRVGYYVIYPSFRLVVPNDTPAGTYTTTITYSLYDASSC